MITASALLLIFALLTFGIVIGMASGRLRGWEIVLMTLWSLALCAIFPVLPAALGNALAHIGG